MVQPAIKNLNLYSPSKINSFLTCPKQYQLKYKFKVRELPTPDYFRFGSDIHKIIRRYYENIPENVSPKEVSLFISQAIKKVSAEISDKLLQHIRGFTKFEECRLSWHVNPKPVLIEKEIKKPPFHGIIDAMFRKDSESIVVDWKSGYGWNPQLDEKMLIQGNIYRYLTHASHVYFIFVRYNKWLEIPKPDEKLVRKIKIAIEGIESGVNNRVEGWHCRNCGVNIYCNFEKRGWTLWNL